MARPGAGVPAAPLPTHPPHPLPCAVQLNNDAVVNAISSQLSRDPAFVALMDRFDAPNPGLPAPARMLLLEEVTGAGDAYPAPSGGEEGASPLVLLLQGIQRGVAVAAGRMGEVRL